MTENMHSSTTGTQKEDIMVENQMQVFESSEFGKLEVVMIEGKPHFPAKECAEMLGYAKARNAIESHCPHALKWGVGVQTGVKADGSPAMQTVQRSFIPEGDLYRLIIRSKLPAAEKFERWVFDEVLPTIRKHGAYMTPETLEKALLTPDFLIKLATELKTEQEKRIALEQQIETDKPFTDFGYSIATNTGVILVRDFAKILRNDGIVFGEKRLYEWLRSHDYLMADNQPYQRYVEQGWFVVMEYAVREGFVARTTKITGKGQKALLEAIKADLAVGEDVG